jgi:tetratricopeptide (TPR) repeat protein
MMLTEQEWAAVAGGGVLVLLLVVLIVRRRRLDRNLPVTHRNASGRKALRDAERAAKEGRHADAAQAWEEAGCIDKAVLAQRRAGRLAAAADVLVRAGRTVDAAALYRQSGKWAPAGRLYLQARRYADAGEMLERAGERVEAARAWAKAGDALKAGELYAAAGEQAEAVAVLYEGPDRGRWLDAFLPWWEGELARQHGRLEPAAQWRRWLEEALDAASAAARHADEARLAAYLGRWAEAAMAAEAAGKLAEARRLYGMVGDLDGEARMAEALGEDGAAAAARAQVAAREGQHVRAAELWEAAGRMQEALAAWQAAARPAEVARVAEGLGEVDLAASAWREAGEPARAAVLLERLERWAEAATAFGEAVNPQRAAECWRRAAQWAAAAEAAHAAGDDQAAIRDWQQHLRSSPSDRAATLRMTELMLSEGMRGAARSVLEPLAEARPSDEAGVDVLYRLGMIYEEEQRPADAARAYERILAFDLGYRDARERAERLRRLHDLSLSAPPQPLPVAGGATQQIMDRYQPQGELGRGGMGVVLKAEDRMLQRTVALKLVRIPSEDPAALDAVLREARATARLNHPNIVQIYDCSLAGGSLVMAMEFVDGQSVKALIDREGALPLAAIVLIYGQVARALEYAHGQGVIHRDVKPANILWTQDRVAKLTDFGLARASDELLRGQTTVMGSPHYMAPEQIMGEAVDARCDLYALGVSLFEAATGSLPFPRGDAGYQHIHAPAPDPRQWRADLPEELASLIRDLMAKKPADRPASAREVLDRLRAVLRRD